MGVKWLLKRQKTKYGPYTLEELKQYASEGRLSPEDLLKSDDMSRWIKAADLPELSQALTYKIPPQTSGGIQPGELDSPTSEPKPQKNSLKKAALIVGAILGLALIGLAVFVATAYFMTPVLDSEQAEEPTIEEEPMPEQVYLESIDEAVENWWAETRDDPIINSDKIDLDFYDQELYHTYSYGYAVQSVEDEEALVMIFLVGSEPLEYLTFIRQNGRWAMVQTRPFPGVGFQVISMLGKHKDEIIAEFGNPDNHLEWDDGSGSLYYNLYSSAFLYTPGDMIVDQVALDGLFFDVYLVTVGMPMTDVEAELGQPGEKGYNEELASGGVKPPYFLRYTFDQGPYQVESRLRLEFYSSEEDGVVELIQAYLLDL